MKTKVKCTNCGELKEVDGTSGVDSRGSLYGDHNCSNGEMGAFRDNNYFMKTQDRTNGISLAEDSRISLETDKSLLIEQSKIVLRSSNQMLESLKKDNLEKDEMWEWYGYIRAIRDVAFELRLECIQETQNNLTEAYSIIKMKLLGK